MQNTFHMVSASQIKIIKNKLKKTFLFSLVLRLRKKIKQSIFRKQRSRIINIHGIDIIAPVSHTIHEMVKCQPLRDLNVGIITKYASLKYPSRYIVDIGANIGDTAIIISDYCKNPLILIEGSEFYINHLHKNSSCITNSHSIHNVIIGDGNPINGALHHWGGTAFIDTDSDTETIETTKLSKITNESEICFIKSDTDGHDFSIMLASLDVIAKWNPVLLIENQIRTIRDVTAANELLVALCTLGYEHFITWNSMGQFMLASNEMEQFSEIARYSLESINSGNPIGDLDIAFFHKCDFDIYFSTKTDYKDFSYAAKITRSENKKNTSQS